LKNLFLKSEFLSLDAKMTVAALPNGHGAIDRHVRHCLCECGFHSYRATRNTIEPGLSNIFPAEKRLLEACRMAAPW
jgi:hypothetical protein